MIFSRYLFVAIGIRAQEDFVCKDLLPDDGCGKLLDMCTNFYHANYQCAETCGKCTEDPLRPINTVN
jgi:hypothetical protein